MALEVRYRNELRWHARPFACNLETSARVDRTAADLILLDINMPKKDGFEVLEAIKADPQLQPLPVIMLTTSERVEDVVRSYVHGACSYIRKPVSLERFIEVVKQFEVYWTLVSLVPGRRE